jgi:RNA polymerase sigma-70 factor (ECF subfamily)
VRVTPLAQTLLAACSPACAAALERTPDLDSLVDAAVRAGREAWPQLEVPEAELLRHVARQLPAEAPEKALSSLHAADLHLALSCLRGSPQATQELDRRIRAGPLAAVVQKLGARAPSPDEIHAHLLQRLLMAEGARTAKLAEYSGRGPLDAWLQVVALRVALNLAPPDRREIPLDELLIADDGPATGHPELDFLRARFGGDFRKALQRAIASLSARDRTVLRLSVVDGLNIDAIGRTFSVHRATVARWIAAAREQIVEGTRAALRENLKLGARELDSLLGLADSKLEVSLGRFLSDSSR